MAISQRKLRVVQNSFKKVSARPSIYNATASKFATIKTGLARVTGATGRARIVVIGDSTSWGEGGGDSGGNLRVNAKENCWPTQLAKSLTTLGFPANYENLYCSGANTTVTSITDFQNAYKTGFNTTGGWAFSASTGPGGCLFTNTTDTTGVLSYTPQINVDTFELCEINSGTASAIITYNVDGGAETQITQSAAASLRFTTIPAGSVGSHTLNIKRVSGASVFIIGVRAYDSTTSQVDVINIGRGSSQTSDWIVSANPWSPLNGVTSLCSTADLVIIDLTINDALLGATVAAYKANLKTIIAQAAAGGASILLLTGNPSATTTIPDITQQTFRQAMRDVANDLNLPMIDQWPVYGDWNTLNTKAWMYNANHPNKLQYADLGAFVANAIAGFVKL